jgi:hypothetical protein
LSRLRPLAIFEGNLALTYKMVAQRNNETFKSEKGSVYTALANARIWASEGWRVTVTDAEGKQFGPDELAKRVSEMQRAPVKAVAESESPNTVAAETEAAESEAAETEAAETEAA